MYIIEMNEFFEKKKKLDFNTNELFLIQLIQYYLSHYCEVTLHFPQYCGE
jgi:hypothetical protein